MIIPNGAHAALAFDRASVRNVDADGRLHVSLTNISMAAVNDYLGREIPGFEALGLDPDKIYRLYRDSEELEKAAVTFNNLPLLSKHVPVSATDSHPELVVGSSGTDAEFEAPYLKNSLVIWRADAIAAVESGASKELSCAYRYEPDMTPGTANGDRYDGVMRNLIGNHIALVPEGRAGKTVVVGDSNEEINMKKPLTRKAAVVHGAILAHVAPKLAQDAKIDLTKAVVGVTAKNFKERKAGIITAVKSAAEGKLAQDATLDDLTGLLDKLEEVEPTEDAETVTDPNAATPQAKKPEAEDDDDDLSMDDDPMAKVKEFLKGKISDADMAELDKLCTGEKAMDADGDEPDDKKDEKDMVSKPAMDAAIKAAVKIAHDAATKTQREIRDAERAVQPYVGELAIAFDSAEAVYAHTLKALNVKIDGVHASAYPALLAMVPKPGSKSTRETKTVAMDAAPSAGFPSRYPDAARIGQA